MSTYVRLRSSSGRIRALVALALLLAPAALPALSIPSLPRIPAYDWLNVRDLPYAAVGDGRADDTDAIQLALDAVGMPDYRTGRQAMTVYLPAGTYRITRPLRLGGRRGMLEGAMVIGDGALTHLVWAGSIAPYRNIDGEPMLEVRRVRRSRIEGMVFDGARRAACGIRLFGCSENDYVSLSFNNHLFAGVQYSSKSDADSFRGCVFSWCNGGIFGYALEAGMLVADCHFEAIRPIPYGGGNGWSTTGAVNSGNVSIRDCSFAGGQKDLVLLERSSVRSCSFSSHAKDLWYMGEPFIQSFGSTTIQDCRFANSADDRSVLEVGYSTTLAFDNVVTDTAIRGLSYAPPFQNRGVLVECNNRVSFNRMPGGGPWTGSTTPSIPLPQRRGGPYPPSLGGSRITADSTFVTAPWSPRCVFDASDEGVVGDGIADDTAAIQRTIDHARAAGGDAMAYIPPGTYRITASLDVTGDGYAVRGGGSGYATRLVWDGRPGHSVVLVHDADDVRIERLAVGVEGGSQDYGSGILQFGNRPSGGTVRYDSIWVHGHAPGQGADLDGLYLADLSPGSVALLSHVTGNTRFAYCSRGTVLAEGCWAGTMTIEGDDGREGFFGALAVAGSQLRIRDNLSVVIADYRGDAQYGPMEIAGRDGQPPGRVTIDVLAARDSGGGGGLGLRIDGYNGQVALVSGELGGEWLGSPFALEHVGDRGLDLVAMLCQGNGFTATLDVSAVRYDLGDLWDGQLANRPGREGQQAASLALDDLRMLRSMQQRAHHPADAPSPFPTAIPALSPR